jgi:hypothetical protein
VEEALQGITPTEQPRRVERQDRGNPTIGEALAARDAASGGKEQAGMSPRASSNARMATSTEDQWAAAEASERKVDAALLGVAVGAGLLGAAVKWIIIGGLIAIGFKLCS